MPALPLSFLPEQSSVPPIHRAISNFLEIAELNAHHTAVCKCHATHHGQHASSPSSAWIPAVDIRCCPVLRFPAPVCLLSRSPCTHQPTFGRLANCIDTSPPITFNSTSSNSYSNTLSFTNASSCSHDSTGCVPAQSIVSPVEPDVHSLHTIICSTPDHVSRAYHPAITHVPGTLVFSPGSSPTAQTRNSLQFGSVFHQGSPSSQFVPCERIPYQQPVAYLQECQSKSFEPTSCSLPTSTLSHFNTTNYLNCPLSMSLSGEYHNRFNFPEESLQYQFEQCSISDKSNIPLDNHTGSPRSTTAFNDSSPDQQQTHSARTEPSSFIRSSVSDIPLSTLEEILARSSIDDVYLGPVEDKAGKLVSLDPNVRVTSERALLPYSSSSLAFSPPGVFMVTEMWSSFASERLSHCNHRIHGMNLASLRRCCYDHGLNQLGSLTILRRRLQEFVRRVREAQSMNTSRSKLFSQTDNLTEWNEEQIEEQTAVSESSLDKTCNSSRTMKLPKPVILTPDTFYSYLLIIDLEATCDFQEHRQSAPEYPHEIIEFPILLYNTRTRKCVGVFHAYCRPKLKPDLTAFCTSLTQISQYEVDNAHPFPQVLARIENWLFNIHGLSDVRCAVVCDCSADMGKFMRIQCRLDGIPLPSWATVWINLSKAFRVFYKLPARNRVTLSTMLRDLNLSFIGQQHRGMDDAINILRVVRTLLADGCLLRVNERVDFSRAPTYVASVPRLIAETTSGLMGSRLPLLTKRSRLNTGVGSQSEKDSRSALPSDLPEDHIQSLLWLANVQKSRVPKD